MPDSIEPIIEMVEDDAPVEVAERPREPTAYEKKLRTEARQYRQRAQEAERVRDEAIRKVRSEADEAVAAMRQAADQRVIRAELKAQAVRGGIVDLDGLRLLDLTGVKLDEAGEVQWAEAMIAELRGRKPWLFGAVSSSSTAKAPQEQPMTLKSVRNMSRDEWQTARADLLRRR